jgi:hypothetical protein
MRPGYVGFSWTTLFFGAFPALFRDDFLTFLGIFAVLIVIGLPALGIGPFIAMFVWAFSYNRYYTRRLIEKGYVQADTGTAMVTARMKLGIA